VAVFYKTWYGSHLPNFAALEMLVTPSVSPVPGIPQCSGKRTNLAVLVEARTLGLEIGVDVQVP